MNWLMMKMMDPMMDDALTKMMTVDYPENPFTMMTIAEKLTPRAIIEAGIRAELGTELQRPIGGPLVLSPWEKILLNPKQLFQLPTPDVNQIDTKTVIGPYAKRPLNLDIPIMITGMSYGGSLSLKMKTALAKGAAMAGTSTNTGESAVTNEERDNARYLIGQFNRGGFLNNPEQLARLDAIEVQLGQGAFGGGVQSTIKSNTIGEHLRMAWHLNEEQDATIYSRMPNVNTPQEIIDMLNNLKQQYDVPIGIKIAGSDYIEYELEVISQSNIDFIVIDGSEGGTAAAPPTLEENVGLPTLHSLVRAADWLQTNGLKDKYTLIAAGGLKTPGHFLKALSLGADAVYIGSIALMAALQTQMTKALPQAPPPQIALYIGKLKDELDVDKAATNLANFLFSCVAEMKLAVQAIGKNSIKELDRSDLVATDKNLAQFLGIRDASTPRPKNEYQQYILQNKAVIQNEQQQHLQ